MTCPACGSLTPRQSFCSVCGRDLRPRTCQSCGGEIHTAGSFCGACGIRVGPPPQAFVNALFPAQGSHPYHYPAPPFPWAPAPPVHAPGFPPPTAWYGMPFPVPAPPATRTVHGPGRSLLNAIGAALILVSLYFDFNFPSVVVEFFWLLISLFGIGKWLWRRFGI